MSRLISGALVAALLVTPALGAVPANAGHASASATVTRTAAAPGVEVGPVRVVLPRCGGEVVDQAVVTDRQGVSTTAFQCWAHRGRGSDIVAARTRPDGTWGPPVVIAPGLSPNLVVDGAGRVTVSYRLRHGDGVGAVRWSGGAWQTPAVMKQPDPHLYFVPGATVATNPRGDTILVWSLRGDEAPGGRHIGIITAFRPHDGNWGPSVVVARKTWGWGPSVDREGRVSVMSNHVIYRRTTAGQWRESALPTFGGDFTGGAANVRGDLLLAGLDPDGAPGTVSIFERPAGAGWLPAVELPISVAGRNTTSLVLDNIGRAALGYMGVDGSFMVATRPASRVWKPGVSVSAPGVHTHVLRLALDPRGALGACWQQRAPDGTPQLWASIRPSRGDWSAPVRLTGPRWLALHHPAASMRPDGSLLVSWSGKIAHGRATRVSSRLVTPAV